MVLKKILKEFSLFPACYLLLTIHCNGLSAQSISLEGLDLGEDVMEWYSEEAGVGNTSLQMGVLVDGSKKSVNSHPYYKFQWWKVGDVKYRGQVFNNVQMIYNIEDDHLIIESQSNGSLAPKLILLSKDQVSEFSFADSHFIHTRDSVNFYTHGFFQVLYSGSTIQFLAKRTKEFEEVSGMYKELHKYYLKDKNGYTPIRTKSSVIKYYKEYRKQIKEYLKSHTITKLTPSTDAGFSALIKYCEELKLK